MPRRQAHTEKIAHEYEVEWHFDAIALFVLRIEDAPPSSAVISRFLFRYGSYRYVFFSVLCQGYGHNVFILTSWFCLPGREDDASRQMRVRKGGFAPISSPRLPSTTPLPSGRYAPHGEWQASSSRSELAFANSSTCPCTSLMFKDDLRLTCPCACVVLAESVPYIVIRGTLSLRWLAARLEYLSRNLRVVFVKPLRSQLVRTIWWRYLFLLRQRASTLCARVRCVERCFTACLVFYHCAHVTRDREIKGHVRIYPDLLVDLNASRP